jgi:hypothetical protein
VLDDRFTPPVRGRFVPGDRYPAGGAELRPLLRGRTRRAGADGRAAEVPRHRGARALHRGDLAYRAGIALALGTGAALRSAALYDVPGPGGREADMVAQVVAVARSGLSATGGFGLYPLHLMSPAGPQLAGLAALTGAWARAPSVLGAVRESGPLLWLAGGILVWRLARRLGAGRGWASGALWLPALSPAAVVSARQVAPENLAAVWALASVLLALPAVRAARSAPASGPPWRSDLRLAGCLGMAVLSSPVTVAVVPAVLVLWARRAGAARAWAVGAGVLGLAGAAATAVAPAQLLAVHPSWSVPGWAAGDPLSPLLALAVGAAALGPPELRPLAVAVLALVPVGLLTGMPTAALLVPLASVLLAALIAGRSPGPAPTGGVPPGGSPDLRRLAGAAGRPRTPVLLGSALAVLWSVGYLSLAARVQVPSPAMSARAWLTGNLPAGQPVRTDPTTRVALAGGPADWDRFATPAECRTRAAPACASTWWIGAAPPPAPGDTAVARFGRAGAADTVWVRTTAEPDPDPAGERRARVLAGAALTGSPRLVSDPGTASQLRAGLLDPRACTALAALATGQRVRLVALLPVPGEAEVGRPMRQMVLAPAGPAPDGRTDPAAAEEAIGAFFRAQVGPFRPSAMAETRSGVLVRYSPVSPPGLLSAFLPD